MQKLIMPFKRQMMLCGYKNPEYLRHWGYPHYGIDVSTIQGKAGTDATVYASGEGKVVAAGKDAKLGYGIAVLYPSVRNHKTGEVYDLIARYMHLRSISVTVGNTVTVGTPLGVEGKEGTGDYHLHLEFDTDTKWPTYTPQVAGSNFWKKGTDSTVNPSVVLHVSPDQVIVEPTYNPIWLNPEDFIIPSLYGDLNYQALYEDEKLARLAAEERIFLLTSKVDEYKAERRLVVEYLQKSLKIMEE
jgi:murein DD-endopeptidase MepM/ murein hydrolase activator NlpD